MWPQLVMAAAAARLTEVLISAHAKTAWHASVLALQSACAMDGPHGPACAETEQTTWESLGPPVTLWSGSLCASTDENLIKHLGSFLLRGTRTQDQASGTTLQSQLL